MQNSNDIITLARGWLGTPYRHQASLKDVGCDCLGLVRGVWRERFGEEPELPPPYAPDWAEAGLNETLAEAGRRHLIEVPPLVFEPGDVLLFRWRPHLPAKHAGIAVSRTHMIHAQEGAAVSEVALNAWWLRRLAFAFRFPETLN
ncbi:MAG: C40 family peptidase [Alphaproteobacteria bacterium]|nr:C40 family peptidase [Alphaproteobacteria bacterium]